MTTVYKIIKAGLLLALKHDCHYRDVQSARRQENERHGNHYHGWAVAWVQCICVQDLSQRLSLNVEQPPLDLSIEVNGDVVILSNAIRLWAKLVRTLPY